MTPYEAAQAKLKAGWTPADAQAYLVTYLDVRPTAEAERIVSQVQADLAKQIVQSSETTTHQAERTAAAVTSEASLPAAQVGMPVEEKSKSQATTPKPEPIAVGVVTTAPVVAKVATGSPLDGALACAARGIAQTPLRPRTKIAFKEDWQHLASTNPEQIKTWATETPDCNWGSVATAVLGGIWILDLDRKSLMQRIEAETGHKLPKTFRVRSSEGKGHIYFRHDAASLALSNQAYVTIKDKQGEICSARLREAYCVSALSVHPDTNKQYEILSDAEICPAPQWLLDWLVIQQKPQTEKKTKPWENDEPIPEGNRNVELTRLAGKARQTMRMDADQLYVYLSDVNQKRCQPRPLDDSEIRTIADSIGSKPLVDDRVLHAGKEVGPIVQQATALEPAPEIPVVAYPKFPTWVYTVPGENGRLPSIYTGLVKPFCDVNSRQEEFMLMPAITCLLNYLSGKVRIESKSYPLSFFMISIGKRGEVIKSSCARDAVRYFQLAGVMEHAGGNTKLADTKSLVWGAGSPEGLGLEMARTNCKNALLFYDEFSKFITKSHIESSALGQDLLTLYEGDKFQNLVKRKSESFSLEPGAYCASFIACTTTKDFPQQWALISADKDGLDNRFFFLLEPEQLKKRTPMVDVNFLLGALETRKLIDKAVAKGVYSIDEDTKDQLKAAMDELDNRSEIRVEKLALAFAVDMDFDSINCDAVERGLALVRYEIAVKRWLLVGQAHGKIAAAQRKIRGLLQRRKDGRMLKAELWRLMGSDEWDADTWRRGIYGSLLLGDTPYIREEDSGTPRNPWVQLMVPLQEVE